jgi:excinuclease UvrABC nuclease subunit
MDKWQSPYTDAGRASKGFRFFKFPGVYLIRRKESKEIIYIGMSKSNAYKALYRHFETWNDRQYRVTYQDRDQYEVRIILTTYCQAVALERKLIKKYKPKDNREFYEYEEEYIPKMELVEPEECPY